MTAVVIISGSMLAVGSVLAMIRIARGPSILDRTVAFDIITSVLIIGVALEAAWDLRVDTIPLLVALSLVGFLASVAIARFAFTKEDQQR